MVFRITRGPQFRTDTVEIAGAKAIPEAELHARLRTKPGELFTESVVACGRRVDRRGVSPARVHAGEGHTVPVPAPSPGISRADRRPLRDRRGAADGGGDRAHRRAHRTCPRPTFGRAIGSQPNQAYYQPQVGARPRGGAAGAAESRLPVGGRGREDRVLGRPRARGSDLHGGGRSSGVRRSRADRRQRAHRDRHHPPRGDAEADARRSATTRSPKASGA